MKKTFVALATLLTIDAIKLEDGKATFTEDQVKVVDEELLRLQNALKDAEDGKKKSDDAAADLQKQLDKAKDDLKAANLQVENLKQSPAAPKVEDPAHEQDETLSPVDMYNSIKDLI